jgi:acyl dehydratase
MSATSPAPRPDALRLPPETLGATAGPFEQTIDARWLMAYAGALGETDARYFDTASAAGPAAHPLFSVCYEWPVAVALRERAIGAAISPFSVHATHDVVIHRPPRTDDRLSTTAHIVEVRPVNAGSLVIGRYDTVDAAGAPVTTTHYGSIYRGVACAAQADISAEDSRTAPAQPGRDANGRVRGAISGPDHSIPPNISISSIRWQAQVPVSSQLAHVYTECARIWNPIHTDIAVARAAGLPGLILHGTATLALAVSQVVARELDGDPARVRGVAARFTGMVPMPSFVTVRGYQFETGDVHFDAIDAAGRLVLGRGVVKR